MESTGLTHSDDLAAAIAPAIQPGDAGAGAALKLTREDVLISSAYMAMIALVAVFLATASLVWALG
jgi:hypothetical protein